MSQVDFDADCDRALASLKEIADKGDDSHQAQVNMAIVCFQHAKMIEHHRQRMDRLYQLFDDATKAYEHRIKQLENLTDNLSADAFHHEP